MQIDSTLNDKELVLTGGTGSLGKALTKRLLTEYKIKGLRIFSRDELKQWEMKNAIQKRFGKDVPISFLVGDVRDRKRVEMATKGAHIIIHCAAQKQVPSCEENPLEAINTNIIGAQNILYAALENKIQKVLAISTDKAVYPTTLYGASKMAAEKLFINGNVYSGGRNPRFSCVRYGNVLGSRGSIIPLFKKQYEEGSKITITDPNMTRFWITLEKVSRFVLDSVESMNGEEIFIPKMPSASVMEIKKAVVPGFGEIEITGIRPGEKLYEILIMREESTRVIEYADKFVITQREILSADKMFEYRSDTNSHFINDQEIKRMLKECN